MENIEVNIKKSEKKKQKKSKLNPILSRLVLCVKGDQSSKEARKCLQYLSPTDITEKAIDAAFNRFKNDDGLAYVSSKHKGETRYSIINIDCEEIQSLIENNKFYYNMITYYYDAFQDIDKFSNISDKDLSILFYSIKENVTPEYVTENIQHIKQKEKLGPAISKLKTKENILNSSKNSNGDTIYFMVDKNDKRVLDVVKKYKILYKKLKSYINFFDNAPNKINKHQLKINFKETHNNKYDFANAIISKEINDTMAKNVGEDVKKGVDEDVKKITNTKNIKTKNNNSNLNDLSKEQLINLIESNVTNNVRNALTRFFSLDNNEKEEFKSYLKKYES